MMAIPGRALESQQSISDLFDRCDIGLLKTREQWMTLEPRFKKVWLASIKKDLERLIDIVRQEEGRNE